MASNFHHHQQYHEQLQFLHESYPQESTDNLQRLLQKYNGDIDQVSADINQQGRTQNRLSSNQISDLYLIINNREGWPQHIEQVYLDGNNMMFVVDSLRRLCLSRQGRKTEHAIAQIASAWNQHMHISHIDLIFDSTNQTGQLDSNVGVSSAQPTYKTTDDMLIDIARRNENREKNRHTIVVTSDRALSIHLKQEGCQLVTSYMWFAHCVMVLAPDLIKQEEVVVMTPAAKRARYNFDELVRRIVKFNS